MTKIPHQISIANTSAFRNINLMLIHITAALELLLRIPIPLN